MPSAARLVSSVRVRSAFEVRSQSQPDASARDYARLRIPPLRFGLRLDTNGTEFGTSDSLDRPV